MMNKTANVEQSKRITNALVIYLNVKNLYSSKKVKCSTKGIHNLKSVLLGFSTCRNLLPNLK